jgi:diguanylate cyclase
LGVKDLISRMTLEYDLNNLLKDLEPVLEDYTEWFLQVARYISYPGEGDKNRPQQKPASFTAWVQQAAKANFQPGTLKKLLDLHKDFISQAEKILDTTAKSGKPPAFKDFDRLATIFEEFSGHMRRIEKDCLLENSGIDTLTGLRNGAAIRKDFRREMERLARQGKPFSLALVKIDNLDEMGEENKGAYEGAMEIVSTLIKCSLRNFDDAYRLDTNEFVLSLKQADMSGGIQALERLRGELMKQGAQVAIGGKKIPLTLTSCIAEPMPGDSFDDLLDNLRVDLKAIGKEDGAVFEYMEMSPLQRYLKKGQE